MRDAAPAFRKALEQPLPATPHYSSYLISAGDTMANEDSVALVERHYPQYHHLAGSLTGRQTFFSYAVAQHAFGYAPRYSWRE
jgi:hypothetical protein